MGTPRYAHSVSVLDGYLYAIGGHDGKSSVNTVERFDPRTGRWEFVRPMSTCRRYLGSAVLDGHLLLQQRGGDKSSRDLSPSV
ncbi:kelch repeat protein [Cooperia oncophora]